MKKIKLKIVPSHRVKAAPKTGEKMIELRIKFFTNNIAPKGSVITKTCWDGGMLVMERNGLHEIKPQSPVPFHSMQKLAGKIEDVLIAHGIEMLHGGKSGKLFKDQPQNDKSKSKRRRT